MLIEVSCIIILIKVNVSSNSFLDFSGSAMISVNRFSICAVKSAFFKRSGSTDRSAKPEGVGIKLFSKCVIRFSASNSSMIVALVAGVPIPFASLILQKLQQIKAKEKRIYQKKTQLLIKQLEAYDIDITEIDMITAAVLYVQNNHLVDDALQAFTANTDSELTQNNGDVI